MGILKYNSQSFAVDALPDGLIAITEAELNSMKAQVNQFLGLKSRIPVGVDEASISALIEKGTRYDAVLAEKSALATKMGELETSVKQYANLPKEFSVETYNSLVKEKTEAIRNGKLDTLTKKALERAKEQMKQDVSVDRRFIDSSKLAALDPDATDALDKMYTLLDEAHTAQQDFLQKSTGVPAGPPKDISQQPLPGVSPIGGGPSGDNMGAAGPVVAGFTSR